MVGGGGGAEPVILEEEKDTCTPKKQFFQCFSHKLFPKLLTKGEGGVEPCRPFP